jgi:ribonuclease P/MRP protein subunit POP8
MATEPMDTTTTNPSSATASAPAATSSTSQSQPQPKKQKLSHTQNSTTTKPTSTTTTTKPTTLRTLTLRSPPWSYIHLQHLQQLTNPPQPATPTSDPLTIHLHLTLALHSFLGQHGTAVPIDILKIDSNSNSDSDSEAGVNSERGIWIRVPSQDRAAVLAALGGWVGKGGEGWRVLGWGSWGVGVGGGCGRGLFG